MRKSGILCGLMLLILAQASATTDVPADSVRFTGHQPEYAGINLVFERYSNFIIPESVPVASMHIDDDGHFDFTFALAEPTYIFADLGRFRASAYIEPGKSYQLVFPPFQPRTQSERINPHFQPEEVMLGIANREAQLLNRNITEFDAMFDYLFHGNAVELFVHSNADKAKEIQTRLDTLFTFSHPTFDRHKELRYLKLWHMTLRRQDRRFISEYLSYSPINYNLPAFWDIFTTLFTGFFPGKYSDDARETLLSSIRNRERFDSIANNAAKDTLFTNNRELNESVLLFALYEAFYRKDLAENTILAITASARDYASTANTRALATQFYRKMALLRPGTDAPDFSLIDQDGKRRQLEDFKGKFVYLNFVHTKSFNCLRDLQTLEQFQRVFRRELQLVTIVIDDHYEDMELFLKNNKQYKWDFLHFGASPRVLFDYNIQAVPAYYLIDPNGKLSLSPAPAPEENFRELFVDRLRSFQREELRRNPPRERSIFRW